MSKPPKRAAAAETAADQGTSPKLAKKVKKGRTTLERSVTPRVCLDGGLKVISVNVAGLRSVLSQEKKRAALTTIIQKEEPDVFCIQEHKLQEAHVPEARDSMENILPGYAQFWSCSTEKKGYAGVATFVKGGANGKTSQRQQKSSQPTIASFFKKSKAVTGSSASVPDKPTSGAGGLKIVRCVEGMGPSNLTDNIASNEGRLLTLELGDLYIINAYVPNSGAKLDRLEYRTKTWDVNFDKYMTELEVCNTLAGILYALSI